MTPNLLYGIVFLLGLPFAACAAGMMIWLLALYTARVVTSLVIVVCEIIMSFLLDPSNSEHGIDPSSVV